MSNTDSFIEEVSEEVRKDALYDVARKYGWILVVIILGAVGYTAYSEISKANANAAAQARGDQMLAALERPDAAARAAALAEIDAGPAGDLVALQRAAAFVDADDTDAAIAVLDGIAAKSADPLYRDLAGLKSVILSGKALNPDERRTRLTDLSAPGAPFRALALEQLALVTLESGDRDGAIEELVSLLSVPEVSNGQRQRVQQMIVALGGEIPRNVQLLNQTETGQ